MSIFKKHSRKDVVRAIEAHEVGSFKDVDGWPYIFTVKDSATEPSSAFGPRQITYSSLENAVDKYLKGGGKLSKKEQEYYTKLVAQGKNKVNLNLGNNKFYDEQGIATLREATQEDIDAFSGLKVGNIDRSEHEKYYEKFADIVLDEKIAEAKALGVTDHNGLLRVYHGSKNPEKNLKYQDDVNAHLENPENMGKKPGMLGLGFGVRTPFGFVGLNEGGDVPASEQTDKLLSKENVKDAAMFGAEFIPGVGEALAIKRTSDALDKKDYLGAGIEATAGLLGIIPGVGDLAGKGLRTATKAFRKADVEEAEKLLDSPESMKVWQDKNRLPENQRQVNPEASRRAAEDLFEGEITSKEARQRIKDAIPDSKQYSAEDMPDMPTVTELTGSLGKKAGKFGVLGVKGFDLKAGQKVSSRLDIPAYNTYDTWVVSIHDGTKDAGSVVGFGQAIRLKDISFGSKSKEALNIARGKRTTPAGEDKPFGKSTIARIFGDYVPEDPYDLQNEARQILANKSPEWTQVGMNPYRGSAFFDKATGSPVFSADEVIQVGPLVLAKNVQKPTMSQLREMAVRTRDGKLRTFSEGGDVSMQKQMELFNEGGLMDEGGTTDPVSGNDVPVGSLQKEVRDDIPAQLSEGEFVMPADVVRYHGLDKMMALRDEAKAGLARMEAMGQMGNADEATIPAGVPFNIDDLIMDDEPAQMQVGGFVPQLQPYTSLQGQQPTGFAQLQETAPVQQRIASPYSIAESPQQTGELITAEQLVPRVETEFRTYVNAQGQTLQIPFIDGQPLYPIPPGYTLQSVDAQPDPVQQQPDPVQAPTQPVQRDDPSDEPSTTPAATTVFGGTVSNGRIFGGTTYEVSYDSSGTSAPGILGALTGRVDRVTLTRDGKQATMSRDLFNQLKENRTSPETTEIINQLFSYTDAANQQINQSAGLDRGFFGFGGNRKEIENDAAREIYEDLGLEYTNQPLSEALMVQAETLREQAATAQPTVTPTARTIPDPAYREDAVTAQVMGDGTEPTTISDIIPAAPIPSATLTTTGPRSSPIMAGGSNVGQLSTGRPATEGDIARLFGQETTASGTRFDPAGLGFPVGTRLSPVEEQLSDSRRMERLDAPTAPVFADAEVATINRFGKLTDYQKVGDNFFRVKADGTLAAAPATGLTAMNLRNPDSPIVSRRTVSRPTGDDISLPMARPTDFEREIGMRLTPAQERILQDERRRQQRQTTPLTSFEVQAMADRDDSPSLTPAEIEAIADRDFSDARQAEIDKERAEAIIAEESRRQQSQTDTEDADRVSAREGRGNIVTDSSGRPVTSGITGRAVTTERGQKLRESSAAGDAAIERQAGAMRREADRREEAERAERNRQEMAKQSGSRQASSPGDKSRAGEDGPGGDPEPTGTYCCTASWKRNQMTITEIKELRRWHRQQSSMWQEGYDIWGKWVADNLVAKSDWSASVVKDVYEAFINKKYTAKGLFGLAVIIPGVYATAIYRRMKNYGRVTCTN
tara:strand:+ start:409 stop:4893 length:4485 start_codon:yes stop_codon:yes gene_type:complete